MDTESYTQGYVCIYVYMYMHKCVYTNTHLRAITINFQKETKFEKRSYDFEGEQGGVYGRAWGEERDQGTIVI